MTAIEADQPYDIVVDLRQVNGFRIQEIANGWVNEGDHGPENTPYAVSVFFRGHAPRSRGRVIFMTYDEGTMANLVRALLPIIDKGLLPAEFYQNTDSGTLIGGLNPAPTPIMVDPP